VKLLESLGEPDLTENDIADLRTMLHEMGAIKKTEELASSLLVEALHALHQVPAGPARDELETFAHYLLERKY
jgi:geranylgeranyl pyrophosphate synthase